MKRVYTSRMVYRVYLTVKGTDTCYTFDTIQKCANDAGDHVLEKLTRAGISHLEITAVRKIGSYRSYVSNSLEYLIRIV